MRIAFYSDNFYPELSGIVDSILITGQALQERGHSVMYVGPRYGEKAYKIAERISPQNAQETILGMPVARLPSLPLPSSPTGQAHLAFPSGASFLPLADFKPDIIHTHSPYGVGIEALRAARRFKIPLIGTNHAPIEEYFPAAGAFARRYDAWYYNRTEFSTTPYAKLIERMRSIGFKGTAEAMPNPVDLSLFRQPSAAEKSETKQRLGFHGPVILYCGRLSSEKHVDEIIESTAELLPEFPTLTLVIIGHGAHQEELKRIANRLGIEKHVRFTGFLPMERLPEYYRAADIFSIMSTVDTQSLSLMQALACGVPAVAARAGGLPDYLPADCGYLVEPGDTKALSAQMRELLLDIPLRERMGKAGVAFTKEFAPKKIAARWEERYAHICAHHLRGVERQIETEVFPG